MKQPIVLRVYLDGQLELVKQFTESQVVIGKNNGLQLQLSGNYIAPLHAVIEERDNGYYISDLGSEHGVYIDGQKVLDQKIETGDEISIGSYKLQFFVGVPQPVSPSTPQIDNDAINSSPASNEEPPPSVKEPAKEKSPAPKKEKPAVKKETAPPQKPEPEVKAEPPKKKAEPKKVEPKKESAPPQGKVAPLAASFNQPAGKKGYFAPPSQVNNWMPILEPGKGTVVEVSVAWKERIISSHHFSNNKVVTIGSDESCDINVPILGANTEKYTLMKIESIAKLNLTPQMAGYYVNEDKQSTPIVDLFRDNKIVRTPNGHILDVAFGDMVVLELEGGLLNLYIRYVPQAPKTFGAPIFDLTTAESTAVVLAAVVASIFSLYMMVYSPIDLADENLIEEELVRKAKVVMKVPVREKKPEKVVEKPPKPRVVKVDKKPKPTPVKATKQKRKQIAKTPKPNPGKAKGLRKTNKKTNKVSSIYDKGKAVKTSKKGGANAKSVKVDPKSVGMLGVFGKEGLGNKLKQTSDGANGLIGTATQATGEAGFAETRNSGDGMGGKIKNTGGGIGKGAVGIGNIKTGGTGLGGAGSGTGGLGGKGDAVIEIDGTDADFVGSMDRDAILRVIRKNKRSIRTCYEKELNKNKDLHGKLVLQWTIVEKGKAVRPKVVSNTLNRAVASCIMNRLITWDFPEPPENTEGVVTFPFVFSTQ